MQKISDNFQAHPCARELFDLVEEDFTSLNEVPLCRSLISRQIARTDSTAANIEEGYGRETLKDYCQFLTMARALQPATRTSP